MFLNILEHLQKLDVSAEEDEGLPREFLTYPGAICFEMYAGNVQLGKPVHPLVEACINRNKHTHTHTTAVSSVEISKQNAAGYIGNSETLTVW